MPRPFCRATAAKVGQWSSACRGTEGSMKRGWWRVWLISVGLFISTGTWSAVQAEPYELTKNDVMDPKQVKSADISLFGVKLGDPESKAVDILVNEKIPGVKTEQEASFLL